MQTHNKHSQGNLKYEDGFGVILVIINADILRIDEKLTIYITTAVEINLAEVQKHQHCF